MHLFLDCDGVMADFNKQAEAVLGMPPREFEDKFGTKEFWARLHAYPNFYRTMPVMPDAMELYEAVKHLNPTILTGCPHGLWAEPQKREWAAEHFPNVPVITCPSKDKRKYMQPGDIIIDDWKRYQPLWEEAGGVFILHTSAKESIDVLRMAGVIP